MSNHDDSTLMPVTADPQLFEYGIAGAAVLFFGWLYYWLNPPSVDVPLTTTRSTLIAAPTIAPLSLALDTSDLTLTPKTNVSDTRASTTAGSVATTTLTQPAVPTVSASLSPAVGVADLSQLKADLALQQQNELAKLRNELNASHESALNQVRTEMTERQQAEINQLRTQLAAQTSTPSVVTATSPTTTLVAPLEPAPTVVSQPVELSVTPRTEPITMVETTPEPTPDLAQFEQQLASQLQQPVVGQSLILDQVTFDSGSVALNPLALNQIKVAAQTLVKYPDTRVLIRSHTDNIGDFNTNSLLSLMRSKHIRDQLIELGVNSNRLQIEGVGPLNPIASNDTEEGRRKNRRTEIIVTE